MRIMDKEFDEMMSIYAAEYQAGDRTHANMLFECCYKMVPVIVGKKAALFNSIHGNRVLSLDELSQVVVASAFVSISTYKPELSFCAWFSTICNNAFYKLCNDDKKQPDASMDEEMETADGESGSTLADFIPSDTDVEKEAEHNITLEKVLEQFMKLRPKRHQAITLCYLQGMSRKEAALEMDVSESALNNHLKRGSDELAAYCQEYDIELDL